MIEETLRFVDALPASGTSSMQRDILAGRPSMGKSALAVNMAFRVAKARMQAPVDPNNKKKPGVVAFFAL